MSVDYCLRLQYGDNYRLAQGTRRAQSRASLHANCAPLHLWRPQGDCTAPLAPCNDDRRGISVACHRVIIISHSGRGERKAVFIDYVCRLMSAVALWRYLSSRSEDATHTDPNVIPCRCNASAWNLRGVPSDNCTQGTTMRS